MHFNSLAPILTERKSARSVSAMIVIYQDYVHNNGSLWRALTQKYGVDRVLFADTDDILNGILTPSVRAFFMPGGASRYVAAKLNGKGNNLIRTYVERGGLYVGICAGAYYACRRTEWDDGTGQVFHLDNELAFCPAVAAGDLHEFRTKGGKSAAIISIVTNDQKSYYVLYWQGPVFKSLDSTVTVYARYKDITDQPPSVVGGTYGRGKYILMSPHLEIDQHTLQQMQFNVVDNRHDELVKLDYSQLTNTHYFNDLLTQFIG
jgi:glutamine amidotransferase-like uncharacterized protein